ncbi:acyl esterase [Phenylobacterium sp. Root700]|uniref:acyl esterase n=1 Tax=Phenylobacterium sp. Root700 TaxID=1736591 RepID=UPI000ABBC29D|nr:acyl esterase [Phenylobacterium sp. Root700]
MPPLVNKPELADKRSVGNGIKYSICTLVTRPAQYEGMLESFQRGGFFGDDCEYLYLDNSKSNAHDAFSGLNLFLSVARGERVIFCHQDVLLLADGRPRLDLVLDELEALDPAWAVCGNSGGISPGRLAVRITDPHGADQRIEDLPARVGGLDENFLVVKRSANLGFSRDMSGFHLYGTDICIIADVLGHTSYVIDFHIEHLSPGVRDVTLARSRAALVAKYARAFRMRWVTAPCEIIFLSGGSLLSKAFSSHFITRSLYHVGRRFPALMRQASRRR